MSTLTLTFTLLLASTFLCGLQARPLTPTEEAQLKRFVSEVKRCGRIPALGLSLVGDGNVVYEAGFGTANPGTRASANKDTVFCLGGATQAFTAVLLATLLERNGNFTFDSPLQEILEYRIPVPGRYRSDMISLADILGMRTGVSNMDIVAKAKGFPDRFRFQTMLRYAPEVKSFRQDNVYSEALFPFVEDAARQLGGRGWQDLLRQYLFNRLSMDHVAFVHDSARNSPDLAVPVLSYNGKPTPLSMDAYKGQELVAAASSVCASASDMAKWIHFILNKGRDKTNNEIVSEASLLETFRAVQSRAGAGDTRATGFSQATVQVSYTRQSNALGWIKGFYRGYGFVSQDGSLPGYESLTTILPDRNVGVFTAFTGDGGARAYAAKVLVNMYALDLLLQGQPFFDQNSVCDVMDAMVDHTRNSQPQPSPGYVTRASEPIRELQEYEGQYRNFGFGDVTVRRNESGSLKLEYGELGRYILYPTSQNDTFIMTATGTVWYTTHMDAYRKGPHLAVFGTRYNDPNRRIETVTIPDFASDTSPQFSKNPGQPRPFDESLRAECVSACATPAASVWLLLTSAVVLLFHR